MIVLDEISLINCLYDEPRNASCAPGDTAYATCTGININITLNIGIQCT